MRSLLGVSESAGVGCVQLLYTKHSSFDLYIQTYQDQKGRQPVTGQKDCRQSFTRQLTSTSLKLSGRMAVGSTRQRKHDDAANQRQYREYKDTAFRAGGSSTHEQGTVSVGGKEMVLNH